jgi:hypothetical protein
LLKKFVGENLTNIFLRDATPEHVEADIIRWLRSIDVFPQCPERRSWPLGPTGLVVSPSE